MPHWMDLPSPVESSSSADSIPLSPYSYGTNDSDALGASTTLQGGFGVMDFESTLEMLDATFGLDDQTQAFSQTSVYRDATAHESPTTTFSNFPTPLSSVPTTPTNTWTHAHTIPQPANHELSCGPGSVECNSTMSDADFELTLAALDSAFGFDYSSLDTRGLSTDHTSLGTQHLLSTHPQVPQKTELQKQQARRQAKKTPTRGHKKTKRSARTSAPPVCAVDVLPTIVEETSAAEVPVEKAADPAEIPVYFHSNRPVRRTAASRWKRRVVNAVPHRRVRRACTHCRDTKLRCDNVRPCTRCIKHGRADSCHDSEHKRRGRRSRDAEESADSGSGATDKTVTATL